MQCTWSGIIEKLGSGQKVYTRPGVDRDNPMYGIKDTSLTRIDTCIN